MKTFEHTFSSLKRTIKSYLNEFNTPCCCYVEVIVPIKSLVIYFSDNEFDCAKLSLHLNDSPGDGSSLGQK